MCVHCIDPNHEAPTRSDLTAADMDLFRHDERQPLGEIKPFPNHQPYNCPTGRGACSECVPYSAAYLCRVQGCADVTVEGAVCEKHVRRAA